jgi:hypothetical protein
MSQSEIYKTLEDTFEDSIKNVKTTKAASHRVAQQVDKDAGDLQTLLKGQVRTFVSTILVPSHWSPKRQCGMTRSRI